MEERPVESMDIMREIFGQNAEWIESFKMQIPQMSTCYKELLCKIWAKDLLTNKEKSLIFIGICLSQGRTVMLREIVKTLPNTLHIERLELLEIVSTVLISRGPIALATAWEAGILTDQKDGDVLPFVDDGVGENREQILAYFLKNMGRVPDWIKLLDEAVPDGVRLYYSWRNSVLIDNVLPRKIKELTLVAVNAAFLYKEGMRIHAMGFIEAGGNRGELLEGLLMAFIGGGIVAWLEGIAVLTESKIL